MRNAPSIAVTGDQKSVLSERSGFWFSRAASFTIFHLLREAQDEAGRGRFLLVLFFHAKEKYNKINNL